MMNLLTRLLNLGKLGAIGLVCWPAAAAWSVLIVRGLGQH
jgi:hypothetical protein